MADWITAKEFAALLGVTPSSIRVMQRRYHDFPSARKLGNTNVFDLTEAIEWKRRHRAG